MHLKARFKRWAHLMRWLWKGHRSIDAHDRDDGIRIIMCSCGKMFHATPGYERSALWFGIKAMDWIH